MKERWESISMVKRNSCLEVGDGVEADREEWEREGGTNIVVDRTNSAVMIVVNNSVLRSIHI
jgi:hypothetical protein